MMIYKRLLEYIGLEPDRFQIRWISGAEAGKFRDTMIAFCERITELGPIENTFALGTSLGTSVFGKALEYKTGHNPNEPHEVQAPSSDTTQKDAASHADQKGGVE